VLSQKLGFDFEIILTLIELVANSNSEIVITIIKLVHFFVLFYKGPIYQYEFGTSLLTVISPNMVDFEKSAQKTE